MGSISPAFSKYVYELWLLNKNKGLWYETQPSGQPPVNRVVYPGPYEQEKVDHDGQGDAQENADQQPE
jgi:hypothetical protein